MNTQPLVCIHGQLRRACESCDLYDQLLETEAKLKQAVDQRLRELRGMRRGEANALDDELAKADRELIIAKEAEIERLRALEQRQTEIIESCCGAPLIDGACSAVRAERQWISTSVVPKVKGWYVVPEPNDPEDDMWAFYLDPSSKESVEWLQSSARVYCGPLPDPPKEPKE